MLLEIMTPRSHSVRYTKVQAPLIGMCGRLRDPYPPSLLVRFRVHGSDAARRLATPPPTRTSVNPGSPPVPGAEPDRHRATSSPRRSWPGTASGAPEAVGARNGSQRIQPPSDVA